MRNLKVELRTGWTCKVLGWGVAEREGSSFLLLGNFFRFGY